MFDFSDFTMLVTAYMAVGLLTWWGFRLRQHYDWHEATRRAVGVLGSLVPVTPVAWQFPGWAAVVTMWGAFAVSGVTYVILKAQEVRCASGGDEGAARVVGRGAGRTHHS